MATTKSKPAADVGGRLEDAAAQQGTGAAPGRQSPTEAHGGPSVALPEVRRQPSGRLGDRVVFIYGPPKIGKSTLASEFGDVLFFELEPGLADLEVFTTGPIADWVTFCAWVTEARSGKREYDAFCIDTCDMLAERCSEHTNAKLGIMHESDLDFGKGWSIAKKELTRWVSKLAAVEGTGLILLSHSQEVEIKTRNASYEKTVPTLSKGARSVFLDMADVVLFADFEGEGEDERRVLRSSPSRYYEAGDRSGKLPPVVEWPKGHGHDSLVKAWEGKA